MSTIKQSRIVRASKGKGTVYYKSKKDIDLVAVKLTIRDLFCQLCGVMAELSFLRFYVDHRTITEKIDHCFSANGSPFTIPSLISRESKLKEQIQSQLGILRVNRPVKERPPIDAIVSRFSQVRAKKDRYKMRIRDLKELWVQIDPSSAQPVVA